MILDTGPLFSGEKIAQKTEFQVLGHIKASNEEAQIPDTKKDYLSELKCQFARPPVARSQAFLNAIKSSVIAGASDGEHLLDVDGEK
jgi:hypothetical protein